MPVYEYKCEQCGNKFEEIRPMQAANTIIACNRCNSQNTERILSTFISKNTTNEISNSKNNCRNCSAKSCANCR